MFLVISLRGTFTVDDKYVIPTLKTQSYTNAIECQTICDAHVSCNGYIRDESTKKCKMFTANYPDGITQTSATGTENTVLCTFYRLFNKKYFQKNPGEVGMRKSEYHLD